jgi:RNA 2',3'-cyclic 3'-phosphodiesterase
MANQSYRLFIAAELPPPVVGELAAAQDALRAGQPPVRWVAPPAMHLTLNFLGETEARLVRPVAEAMRAALAGYVAPRLRLGQPGTFPGVVWVGVAGEVAELGRLQAALAAALEPLGWKPERRAFTPHLTLGRVRREADRSAVAELAARVRGLPAREAEWHAQHITLFRSELRPAGPAYHALETVALPAH